jgi:hypothetical protein
MFASDVGELEPEGAGSMEEDGDKSPWREEPAIGIEPIDEPEVPHPPATQTVGIQASTSGVHFHMEDAYGRRVWGQIFVDTAPNDSRPVVTQESMARVMEVLLPVVEVECTPLPSDAEVDDLDGMMASGEPLLVNTAAATHDAMPGSADATPATSTIAASTASDAVATCSAAADADSNANWAAAVAEAAMATPADSEEAASLKDLRVCVRRLPLGPLATLEAHLYCEEVGRRMKKG